MADTNLRIQSRPAANTLTAAYTVGASKAAKIGSFTVCNTSSTSDTIRIAHALLGAADAIGQYPFYDVPIAAKDTFSGEKLFTLIATDVIRVYSLNGTCNFHFYGVESDV